MLKPLNYEIIAHPLNWFTIVLMVVIAGAIGHYLLTYLGLEPSTKTTSDYAAVPAGISYVNPPTRGIQPQGADDVAIY